MFVVRPSSLVALMITNNGRLATLAILVIISQWSAVSGQPSAVSQFLKSIYKEQHNETMEIPPRDAD
jgi:hypothetical protein